MCREAYCFEIFIVQNWWICGKFLARAGVEYFTTITLQSGIAPQQNFYFFSLCIFAKLTGGKCKGGKLDRLVRSATNSRIYGKTMAGQLIF